MDRARIEKISKALADATRLRIFEAISTQKEVICGQLVAMRGVTPATISHHLKILSDAGLIECRRKGQFVHNRAIPETIAEYSRALARMAGGKKSVKTGPPRGRKGPSVHRGRGPGAVSALNKPA
jgi:ArsR family transcriptional regulator, arsenate/arsenite/antimonite-responsive transcriptional repressor